jgi:hypothetical protein
MQKKPLAEKLPKQTGYPNAKNTGDRLQRPQGISNPARNYNFMGFPDRNNLVRQGNHAAFFKKNSDNNSGAPYSASKAKSITPETSPCSGGKQKNGADQILRSAPFIVFGVPWGI